MIDSGRDAQIKVLYDISALVRSSSPLDEKCRKALGLIKVAVGCDAASLFLYDDARGTLEEMVSDGDRVDLIESTRFELGAGLSAWVAKQRDSVLLPTVRKSGTGGFRSFIAAPLLAGEHLIGVLTLGHAEPGAFTEEHQQFVEIIAGQFATTIERSRYEDELVEKNSALQLAQREIKKQHEQLVQMEKYQAIGQVVASINHEINNPLTTIIGNIELLLLRSEQFDEPVLRRLRLVLDESRRIGTIVEKLRDLKKIVVRNYLDHTGETMVDIDRSAASGDEEKNS